MLCEYWSQNDMVQVPAGDMQSVYVQNSAELSPLNNAIITGIYLNRNFENALFWKRSSIDKN